MKLILITTHGRFVPKESDNFGFNVLNDTIDDENEILFKDLDDCRVFVTKCIDDESDPQIVKHNKLAEIIDIAKKNCEDFSDIYCIAHDADLLSDEVDGYSGLFTESDFECVERGDVENRLHQHFENKDGHLYMFRHTNGVAMYTDVIQYLRPSTTNKLPFSIEHIKRALEIIKNEA